MSADVKQRMPSGHDTVLNSGGTWIRPIPHLAANRQQPDDPSGVESTHPEHTGRLRVAPAGRAFTNHWKRGPYLPQGWTEKNGD
jgi:hypothetical protein